MAIFLWAERHPQEAGVGAAEQRKRMKSLERSLKGGQRSYGGADPATPFAISLSDATAADFVTRYLA